MYCNKCGKVIEKGAKLCRHCGAVISVNKVESSKITVSSTDLQINSANLISHLFSTRLNRISYMCGGIGITLFLIVGSFLISALTANGETNLFSNILSLAVFFILIFYSVSFTVRRLHDLGQSGWLTLIHLIGIIPILGWLVQGGFGVYLLFAPGQSGTNRFGHQPTGQIDIKNIFGLPLK